MTNKQLEDIFFQYLKIEKQYSQNTIVSYQYDIIMFNDVMEKNYMDITLEDAKMYMTFLRDRYANNTVLRKVSSIKSLYKFLEGEQIIEYNVWM
ncbi:MAG: site-specific integrase, partial [Mycoplasmatales bacterium]